MVLNIQLHIYSTDTDDYYGTWFLSNKNDVKNGLTINLENICLFHFCAMP